MQFNVNGQNSATSVWLAARLYCFTWGNLSGGFSLAITSVGVQGRDPFLHPYVCHPGGPTAAHGGASALGFPWPSACPAFKHCQTGETATMSFVRALAESPRKGPCPSGSPLSLPLLLSFPSRNPSVLCRSRYELLEETEITIVPILPKSSMLFM